MKFGTVVVTAFATWAAACFALESGHAYTLKVHHSFCAQAECADGESPGGVLQDGAGNLFGATGAGGTYGRGTAFKLRLNKTTGKYVREVLHHFCAESLEINCADGAYPIGGLIRDKSGNLYGITYQGGAEACAVGGLKGCGVVFALLYNATTRTYTHRRLLTFNGTGSGTTARSGSTYPTSLVLDADGNLYGATIGAGANDDYGAVFKLTPLNAAKTRWSHKVLYTFCRQSFCTDGRSVYAPLTIDRFGNLYGTTFEGGEHGNGTVFALMFNASTGKHTFKRIHSFCPTCGSSVNPGQVMVDRAGHLFGTTRWDTGEGTVFKLTPNAAKTAWAYKTLRQFCAQPACADGSTPSSNLVMDGGGNIFGAASDGGRAGDHGVMFQLVPNAARTAWSYRLLYRFCARANCTDGSNPGGKLTLDAEGNLLLATGAGGANDGGAVVEFLND